MTFGDILLKNFGGSCCKSINGLVLIYVSKTALRDLIAKMGENSPTHSLVVFLLGT